MTDAFVMGRLGIDLYPNQLRTPLREVRTYTRFVGGFAGNVATGLARLGVRVGILSRVGGEGHGEFVRGFLESEGVDVRFLRTDPYWPTPITFCEVWPPDDFPMTFYRTPTAPDWELTPEDFDPEEVAAAALLYATGTGLARSPSRATTLATMRAHRGTTILDLDWRPMLWEDEGDYPGQVREAIALADLVVGNEDEAHAAAGGPEGVLEAGAEALVLKRGANGASVYSGGERVDVPAVPVQVVNGLGAGDAFAAALGQALLEGLPLPEGVRRANAAGALVAAELACSEAMPRPAELEGALV